MRLRAHGQALRVGVLARVAHGLGEDRLRERLERGRHARDLALDADAEVGVLGAQALELGGERRAGRRRRAPERALQRGAQLAERGAHLGRAARPRLGAQRLLGGQRERHAEQALDDAVVDVAREVDALLELARALAVVRRGARGRRQRERLAEHPQQLAAWLVDRRGAGVGLGEDDADPAPGRDDRDVDERVVADELCEVLGDVVAVACEHLDDAVLGQRLARDRRGLDGHVAGGEAVESEPVRAARLDAAAGVVVAEDHRRAACARSGRPPRRGASRTPPRRTRRRRPRGRRSAARARRSSATSASASASAAAGSLACTRPS